MVEIVRLAAEAERPSLADHQPWLYVEETDGLFFGSGGAWNAAGEWVGYGSLSEHDVDLTLAVEAACEWAKRYSVPTIWVFASK